MISVPRFNPTSRNQIAVRPQTAFQTQRVSTLRSNTPSRHELNVPNPEANLTTSTYCDSHSPRRHELKMPTPEANLTASNAVDGQPQKKKGGGRGIPDRRSCTARPSAARSWTSGPSTPCTAHPRAALCGRQRARGLQTAGDKHAPWRQTVTLSRQHAAPHPHASVVREATGLPVASRASSGTTQSVRSGMGPLSWTACPPAAPEVIVTWRGRQQAAGGAQESFTRCEAIMA